MGDEELYSRWKKLEAHREFLSLQEASVGDEYVYRATEELAS